MAKILDSYGPVDPKVLKENGFVGIARYVSQVSGKCITRGEFYSYIDAGLTVVLVYEDSATDAYGGTATGEQKGLVCRSVLQSLGIFDPVVFFGVDTDLNGDAYDTAYGCVTTFAATAGCVAGVYGPGPLLRFCQERGIKYLWEPGATAWNQGVYLGQLYQRHYNVDLDGYEVDIDISYTTDYGQWPRPTAPAPSPAPSEEEFSMFCNDKFSAGSFGTDANGALYNYNGSPFIQNLEQHPDYHAGSEESGDANPCVGIACWGSEEDKSGITFFTKPTKPPASQKGPYSTYNFNRNGTPA